MVYRACRRAARSGRAESSVPTRSVIASQCLHWLGNPFLQCGGTHGSRPTGCGAEQADRVVRPYTLCHCEPVLTLARQSVPPMRRDTWVPPYRVRRGAGGQSRPPLHGLSLRASAHTGAAIRPQRGAAALTGRRGRRPLRDGYQDIPRGTSRTVSPMKSPAKRTTYCIITY